MILELLRVAAEFTPTERDNELLDDLESFLERNPEIAALAFKLMLGFLKSKG